MQRVVAPPRRCARICLLKDNSMVAAPAPRLDGWKAIADYLGRDVRTVQRWRDERGMPVHRVPGGRGGAVFAVPLELDQWLFQASLATRKPIDSTAAERRDVGPFPQSARKPAASWRKWLRAATVVTCVLALGGVAVAVIIDSRRVAPARVESVADAIVARAADDSVLWTYRLPERPGSQLDGAVVGNAVVSAIARADFHGPDPDVLAAVTLTRDLDSPDASRSFLRNTVYRLSSNGKLRWMFSPLTRLTFAGREFAGQWVFGAWVMLPGTKPRLWVAFRDRVWWPSFIVSLGSDGIPETMFVNAGHIWTLVRIQVRDEAYVLAGGVNNEYRAAALAVLDERDAPSASPQSNGSPFSCDTCPSGRPREYFVFPRLEVAAANGVPYEYADPIHVSTNSSDFEVSITTKSQLDVRAVYRFSGDAKPESVAMSDRYWEIHRDMFKTGKLDHAPEDCPERTQGVVVRMWQSGTGWTDVKVPPTFAPPDGR